MGLQKNVAGRLPAGPASSPAQASDIFTKTKLCKFHLVGACSRGRGCVFAHTDTELQPLPDLHRTKLCKMYLSSGECKNVRCTYAHSKDELRSGVKNRKKASAVEAVPVDARRGPLSKGTVGAGDKTGAIEESAWGGDWTASTPTSQGSTSASSDRQRRGLRGATRQQWQQQPPGSPGLGGYSDSGVTFGFPATQCPREMETFQEYIPRPAFLSNESRKQLDGSDIDVCAWTDTPTKKMQQQGRFEQHNERRESSETSRDGWSWADTASETNEQPGVRLMAFQASDQAVHFSEDTLGSECSGPMKTGIYGNEGRQLGLAGTSLASSFADAGTSLESSSGDAPEAYVSNQVRSLSGMFPSTQVSVHNTFINFVEVSPSTMEEVGLKRVASSDGRLEACAHSEWF